MPFFNDFYSFRPFSMADKTIPTALQRAVGIGIILFGSVENESVPDGKQGQISNQYCLPQ